MFDIVFLGTGAMKPTPQRFTASLMLRYRGEVFMFDAGEGIQVRVQQGGFSPMKIDNIFITHFHGDHFYGLPGMVFTMAKSHRERPLNIYGPRGAARFVDQLLSVGYGHVPFPLEVSELAPGTGVKGEGYEIGAFETDHGPPSLGYLFREADRMNVDAAKMKELGLKPDPQFRLLKQGQQVEVQGHVLKPEDWLVQVPGGSLAYVGDTRYSRAVVEAVGGATVLVHEATYASGDTQEDRGHSSAADAARVAKYLFLTHISSRYADPSPLLKEAREIFPETHVARDLQKVTVKKGRIEGL
jgi:ribonuclease Z